MKILSNIAQVSRGEIKLALGVIETGVSYEAMSALLPVIKSLDPQSRVLQELTLGSRKLSYTISDSIGPFFYERNMQKARRAPAFSLKFDAASTKRGGLSKDLGTIVYTYACPLCPKIMYSRSPLFVLTLDRP